MRYLIWAAFMTLLGTAMVAMVGCGDEEAFQSPITPYAERDDFVAGAPASVWPKAVRTERPYVQVFYVEPAPTPPDDEFGIRHWGEPRTDAEIAEQKHRIREEMKSVQEFFAAEMERHLHGRKTFEMVMNAWGEIDIAHINLNRPQGDYQNGGFTLLTSDISEWEEARSPLFDNTLNVYFIDMYAMGACGYGGESKEKAWNFCWDWRTVAHEIGHACGLEHDFRDRAYMMSYGHSRSELSEGAAAWLSHHRAFNKGIGFPNHPHHLRDELSRVTKIVDVNPLRLEIRLLYAYTDENHPDASVPPRETTSGYESAVVLRSTSWSHRVVAFADVVTFKGMEKDVMQQDGTRWVDIAVYEVDFGDTVLPDIDEVWIKMIGTSSQQTQSLHVPLPQMQ